MDDDAMDEYNLYWETKMFLDMEEIHGWGLESLLDECNSSGLNSQEGLNYSSPSPSSRSSSSVKPSTKMMENKRSLNERLYSLRSVVPNITKMDKVSILTDAIGYIKELQEQERSLMEEILQLGNIEHPTDHKSCPPTNHNKMEYDEEVQRNKKMRYVADDDDQGEALLEPIQVRTSEVGERTWFISMRSSKQKDVILKLCEVLQSINLKIVTANIISFSGALFHTIIIEGDEVDAKGLKEKIEMSDVVVDEIQPCLWKEAELLTTQIG